jgi:positive regulator of sigma E activity
MVNTRSSDAEVGIVTALIHDEAIVELSLQESCDTCGARMICVPDSSGKRRLRAANPLRANIGNQVAITEKSNFLLLVSFLQYGIPFVGFLIGIFAIYAIKLSLFSLPQELIMFLGGLLGLFGGALIARFYVERLAETTRSFFEIAEILR